MGFDTNILKDKISQLREAVEKSNFSDVLFTAINAGNGLMQQRIFGTNVDIQGNSFGTYVGKQTVAKGEVGNKRSKSVSGRLLTPYQRKRALRGRQTVKKDLELEGSLRRSIETVVDDRTAVLQFTNDESAKIARGQENQITNIRNGATANTKGDGIKIFAFNETERDEVNAIAKDLIRSTIRGVAAP